MCSQHARVPRLVALAALLCATPLQPQQDDLARVRDRFGEVATERIASVIELGERDGLPRRLLVDKAVEGVAKDMEPDVVLQAVSAFAADLRVAMSALGREAEPERLANAADALRGGIDVGLLAFFHRASPDQFRLIVVALEELLDLGVDRQLAEDLMRYAATQGLEGDEVLAVPAQVRRQVRNGRTPGEAASNVSRTLRDGGGAESAADGPAVPALPTRAGRRIPPLP